jgi:LPS-assembly lipoprotein
LLLLLSACGFHLRGNLPDQVQLPPTYLAGNDGPLKQELRHYLAIAGSPVVDNEKGAQLVIDLLKEDVQRRVLSVDSSGRVNEYEVDYAATYSVKRTDGKTVIAPETLDQQRSYTFDQSEVLAKDQEQERLVQDMRGDAVRRMMLRLQAALKKAP